jgi:DNA-binding transcriptional ArsR family regulator
MDADLVHDDVFQAIADHHRRKIIRMLADEEMPVTAIAGQFTISRTAVNKHLHVLTEAGLLYQRKVGRETRYKLRPAPLSAIQEWVAFYEQYWSDKLNALKEYVETGEV